MHVRTRMNLAAGALALALIATGTAHALEATPGDIATIRLLPPVPQPVVPTAAEGPRNLQLEGFDFSRSVVQVQQVVRARHAGLLLPTNGEVLNRLTVFLSDEGQIVREVVEQTRFDALRRAPLEDAQFAERIAERVAQTLSMDASLIGVVGFTYVNSGGSLTRGREGGSTLLVQYAFPRRPGETGPSMPMANAAQQRPQSFDTAAALALAEHYFSSAFGSVESAAGTPTVVLDQQGRVLRAGLVQYRSGQIHEVSLQQQLMPDARLVRLVSPTLRNSAGSSAVVTFAWVSTQGQQ